MPEFIQGLASEVLNTLIVSFIWKVIKLIFRKASQEKNELGGERDYSSTYKKVERKLIKKLRKKDKNYF